MSYSTPNIYTVSKCLQKNKDLSQFSIPLNRFRTLQSRPLLPCFVLYFWRQESVYLPRYFHFCKTHNAASFLVLVFKTEPIVAQLPCTLPSLRIALPKTSNVICPVNPTMNSAFVPALPPAFRSFSGASVSDLKRSRAKTHLTFTARTLHQHSHIVGAPVALLFNNDKAPPNANNPGQLDLFTSDLQARFRSGLALASKGVAVFAIALALTVPLDAMAARSGGSVRGSQFRSAPSRVAPSSPSRAPYGGGGGYGYGSGYGYGYGGFGPGIFISPFVAPFGGFGLGLGGIGGLLAIAAVASVVTDVARSRSVSGAADGGVGMNTGIVTLKVGLLSSARSVQVELDNMARLADTTTIKGLTYVVQTSATALLRNPDYWMYGAASARTSNNGESDFNEVALSERLKLQEETLSNSGGIKYENEAASATEQDMAQTPKEYIIVTFVVAADGQLVTQMPKVVDSAEDIKRGLSALASVSSDRLQAVEIIWAPQSLRDSLTAREMLEDHPELKQL